MRATSGITAGYLKFFYNIMQIPLFTVKPDRAFLFGWWKRVEARRVAAEN